MNTVVDPQTRFDLEEAIREIHVIAGLDLEREGKHRAMVCARLPSA